MPKKVIAARIIVRPGAKHYEIQAIKVKILEAVKHVKTIKQVLLYDYDETDKNPAQDSGK